MLLKKSIQGITWSFIDIIVNKLAVFLTTIYMARLLDPSVYGLIGMIAIFISIGGSLVDTGSSVSLIRSPRITSLDSSSVFVGSIIISVILYGIFYVLAPFIADFYGYQILTEIIRVYCLIFIILGFRSVQYAMLIRSLEFRKNTLISIPAVLVSISVGVSLAHYGFGVWSLVWLYLSQQIVLTILYWGTSRERIRFKFSKKVFLKHFNFGYKLTLSGIMHTAFTNLNNIFIGKFYPLAQSGYYERAYSLNNYTSNLFVMMVTRVMLPVLSKIQGDKNKMVNIFAYLTRYSFFVMSFLMIIIIVFSKEILLVLLGEKWLPAVPFLQILSLYTAFMPIHTFNVNILQIYGRSDYFLRAEICKKVFQGLAMLVLFQFGLYWLVSSLFFLSVFELYINAYFVSKILPVSVKQQLLNYSKELILFTVALVASFMVIRTRWAALYYWQTLLGVLLLIILVYTLFFYIFERKNLRYILTLKKAM
ncbi:lipopolysaccharide biosynthesis protein [Riemerella columbina]|uniref:lipopolysaccharide biosynthesis protein n=1 Tax=Riemerella columbina TaxID=103810 RepID=UPI00266EBBD6|nr:lipopolysaccharide biosynthesis protein [Riemerella columbina]WKS94940.1 lipopolysaccharide biosynthesis protein [Riemerella columbina]